MTLQKNTTEIAHGFDADDLRRILQSWIGTKSSSTRTNYKQVLRRFARFCGVETGADAMIGLLGAGGPRAQALVLDWQASMAAEGLTQSTIGWNVSVLRSLLRPFRSAGVIGWTFELPARRGRTVRDVSGPSIDECRRMLAALEQLEDPKRARVRWVFRCALDLGFRIFEIHAIDWPDHCPPGELLIRRKKQTTLTRWTRTPAVERALVQLVKCNMIWCGARGQTHNPGPLLRGATGERLSIRTLQNYISELGELAGVVRRVTPNALRHTSYTIAVAEAQRLGISLPDVRQHSGHADVATLMLYQDRNRGVQGQIASAVSAAIDGAGEP